MVDEFHQGGVIGGSWWNSPSSGIMFGGSSLCSSPGGSFGWSSSHLFHHHDIKTSTRSSSSDDRLSSNSPSDDGSYFLQDVLKSHPDSASPPSTTSSQWSQVFFRTNGSSPSNNYSSVLQEDPNSGMNYGQQSVTMDNIQKDYWSRPTKICRSGDQDSSTNSTFKPDELLQMNFGLESFTATCQGLTTNFPLDSLSSSSCSSTLLQTLFDDDTTPHTQKPQSMDINFPSTSTCNYLTATMNNQQQQQQPQPIAHHHQLPFSYASSAAALNDIRAGLLMPSSTVNEICNLKNLAAKANNEEVGKKVNEDEPAQKRPRIGTPSPLPTFKVRKEKLGDRITALQQLVSPFGKTDTASVLHEAIEYIKFLHNQVNVLSTPYMKNGSPGHQRQQSVDDNNKSVEQEGPKQDLKNRGLCLVPISSTFPVAAETTTDFWTPTFGGAFRSSSSSMGQIFQKGEMGSMGWF